jgi:hypothetical protein
MPDAGISLRFYRGLLKLYPAGFRENHAASWLPIRCDDQHAQARRPGAGRNG